MDFISNFYLFFASVMLISLSGVLMPGPLFAVTLKKAAKSKIAGALIAVGHGIVEFPLMFLIFFVLSQFEIPKHCAGCGGVSWWVFDDFYGYANVQKQATNKMRLMVNLKRDSVLAGIYTTAVNAGFILWWLTIGTTLILNAQLFGLLGFSVFAGVHWLCDFSWYTVAALVIFKSQRFLTDRTRMGITFFCVAVFIGFGAYFMGSALWSLLA